MDAASLIQLAKARGIDLKEVAGAASNLYGAAEKRRLSRAEIKYRNEVKLNLDIQETVRGRHTRTYRRPTWSIAELGQAARGLGQIPWAAALYSYAGAQEERWILWSALALEAQKVAHRENWPARIVAEDGSRRFYREELADLVLTEETHKHWFLAAPTLYAIFMDVTPAVWDQTLNSPFRSLKASYDRWLDTARSAIGRMIRDAAHAQPVDNGSVCG